MINFETLPQPMKQAVDEYLWQLLSSYGPLGLLLIIMLLLFLWFALRKKVEGEVEKEVNKHKAEIEYKYSRGIENYKLYIDKKHKVYTEISELLTKAQSAIFGLEGLKNYPDINEFNEDDLKEYLENLNLSRKRVNKYVDKHKIVASKGIRETTMLQNEITKYLMEVEKQLARRAYEQAKSYFWLNNIYFSLPLSRKIKGLLEKVSALVIKYQYPITPDDPSFGKERAKKDLLKKGMVKDLDVVLGMMKKELSAGYHNEN